MAFSIFWEHNSILFLIATLPDKVTFYVFPTTYEKAIIIKETLEDINNITFLEEPNSVKTIENLDALADVISIIYGEEVQKIVRIRKMRYPLIEEYRKSAIGKLRGSSFKRL